MRVATNSISDTIIAQLQLLNGQQTKLQNQVGTGLRITQPEDDPAAMARVLNLNHESRALTQFTTNANRALEISQATYGALQQVKKISDRATEIGTLGTGAQNPAALQAYAAEINQLLEQAVQLANGRLRNDHLFGGTVVDTPPYTVTRDAAGEITSPVVFSGNTAQATIPLSETSGVTPGADAATTQGLTDFLNHLVSLRTALRAGSSADLTTAQTGLLATEDVLISALAEHGAVQLRIEVNQEQQKDRTQNIGQLISAETSTDMTTTVVKLSQAQTAYQAALQSASNIMKQSLLDYLR
jgi:flagellar hook-associated protein 3 FlgL